MCKGKYASCVKIFVLTENDLHAQNNTKDISFLGAALKLYINKLLCISNSQHVTQGISKYNF